MTSVFDTSDLITAQMVCDLLKRVGIRARILGEHLQGGMGDLPAIGLIRVVVPDAHADEAKSVIAESWDDR